MRGNPYHFGFCSCLSFLSLERAIARSSITRAIAFLSCPGHRRPTAYPKIYAASCEERLRALTAYPQTSLANHVAASAYIEQYVPCLCQCGLLYIDLQWARPVQSTFEPSNPLTTGSLAYRAIITADSPRYGTPPLNITLPFHAPRARTPDGPNRLAQTETRKL